MEKSLNCIFEFSVGTLNSFENIGLIFHTQVYNHKIQVKLD